MTPEAASIDPFTGPPFDVLTDGLMNVERLAKMLKCIGTLCRGLSKEEMAPLAHRADTLATDMGSMQAKLLEIVREWVKTLDDIQHAEFAEPLRNIRSGLHDANNAAVLCLLPSSRLQAYTSGESFTPQEIEYLRSTLSEGAAKVEVIARRTRLSYSKPKATLGLTASAIVSTTIAALHDTPRVQQFNNEGSDCQVLGEVLPLVVRECFSFALRTSTPGSPLSVFVGQHDPESVALSLVWHSSGSVFLEDRRNAESDIDMHPVIDAIDDLLFAGGAILGANGTLKARSEPGNKNRIDVTLPVVLL